MHEYAHDVALANGAVQSPSQIYCRGRGGEGRRRNRMLMNETTAT